MVIVVTKVINVKKVVKTIIIIFIISKKKGCH